MTIDMYNLPALLTKYGFSKKKLADYRIPSDFFNDWCDIEFVPFCDKAQTKGILLFEESNILKVAKFELKKLKPGLGGVSKPIICDFCFTLQPRPQVSLITFELNREKTKTLAHYCCADLQCSLHVRGLTVAALRSKSQIKEDILPEARVARFTTKTRDIFSRNNSVEICV